MRATIDASVSNTNNAALGDLMKERVHALAIRARAPGE